FSTSSPCHRYLLSFPTRRSSDLASASAGELREFLAPNFAKFWLPDRIEFISEIPKTSVGKFRKTALREQFAGAGTASLRRRTARDRKSTRLNSSHVAISYAVFCL